MCEIAANLILMYNCLVLQTILSPYLDNSSDKLRTAILEHFHFCLFSQKDFNTVAVKHDIFTYCVLANLKAFTFCHSRCLQS